MANWWEKYQRIPFKEKGRDESGADCWGLAYLIYKNEKGIDVPDYLWAYEDTHETEKISAHIKAERSSSRWLEITDPKPFDLVLMQESAAGMVGIHVGLVIRQGFMIHIRRKKGVVIQPLNAFEWKNRIMGFVRYVG